MNAAQVVNHQLKFSMASFIRTIGLNDQRLTNWMCLVFFVCVQACLAGAAPAACCAASQPVWVRGSLMAVAATRLLRSLWGPSSELSSTLRDPFATMQSLSYFAGNVPCVRWIVNSKPSANREECFWRTATEICAFIYIVKPLFRRFPLQSSF